MTNIIIGIALGSPCVGNAILLPYPPTGYAYVYDPRQSNAVMLITLADGKTYPLLKKVA